MPEFDEILLKVFEFVNDLLSSIIFSEFEFAGVVGSNLFVKE